MDGNFLLEEGGGKLWDHVALLGTEAHPLDSFNMWSRPSCSFHPESEWKSLMVAFSKRNVQIPGEEKDLSGLPKEGLTSTGERHLPTMPSRQQTKVTTSHFADQLAGSNTFCFPWTSGDAAPQPLPRL